MRLKLLSYLLVTFGVVAFAGAQTGISVGPGGSISMNGGGVGCGVSTACAVAAGGTGATTASGALTNLGAFAYPGTTGIPYGTSASASRAATSADITALLGFTPQAALGFTPLNPANNLSEIATPATALKNLGALGWITGTGAPAATCSSSVNTGYIYTNGINAVYQCNNLVGSVYQWNLMGAPTVTNTGTSGAATFSPSTLTINIPRYDQYVSLTTTGSNCGAPSYVSGTLNIPPCAPGGTVTNVSSGSSPGWLPITVSNGTTTPVINATASPIPNSALANTATTVNGQTCTLGSTCTIATAVAAAWPGSVYYLSPSGSDSNAGTFASPWLTPNHGLNCGDTIIALPSTSYSATNFGSGKWHTVTCPNSNGVAWLQCQTFDGCKISNAGMTITASFWGVQGWEINASGTPGNLGPCFGVTPPTSAAGIHHIIIANNVCTGGSVSTGGFGGGISAYANGTASVDYVVIAGNIVYNAAGNNSQCFSGISIYQPKASDTNAGTHIYVAGNFSFGNMQPNPCGGVTALGADGIIFDTFDGAQGLGTIYTQQAVAENNILVDNGGRSWEYQTYTKGTPGHPTVFILNNTGWGNDTDPNMSCSICTDGSLNIGYGVFVSKNIHMTTSTTGGSSAHTLSGMNIYDGSSANVAVVANMVYTASGSNIGVFNDDSQPSPSVSSNTTGTNPNFSAAANPTAPACSGKKNATDCMSTVIGNFTPAASAALGLGYQTVSLSGASNPLFPPWICRVGIPDGIITKSCN